VRSFSRQQWGGFVLVQLAQAKKLRESRSHSFHSLPDGIKGCQVTPQAHYRTAPASRMAGIGNAIGMITSLAANVVSSGAASNAGDALGRIDFDRFGTVRA
jgi:hypothetical protein